MKASISVRSKLQVRWGTPARSSPGSEQSAADPVANDRAMPNAEDPLDVTQADALHPARKTAPFEALDHRGRCPLDAEAVRQFEGNRRSVFCTQKTVD
jgi:hypothetical protein